MSHPGEPGERTYAAADLGATSGRVIVGTVGDGTLALEEVHRFPNTPLRLPTGLHWDLPALYQGVLDGLRAAGRVAGRDGGPLRSLGVDTWAVDHGLLDADGALLGLPYHYRDGRTAGMAAEIHAVCGARELYATTGLQQLPINTVFQLAAARTTASWPAARTLLLVPDLLVYWLSGTLGAEETNASTTGLFDATRGEWAGELIEQLGLDRGLFPPLRRVGQHAGTLLPHVAEATGLPEHTPVTTVASHDTASAVAAVPAVGADFGYVSCGTWSLAGLELDAPVLGEESREANFTNERGVDGTIRYLRNIMGLWLLEECRRTWARTEPGGAEPAEPAQPADELGELLSRAAQAEPFATVIDPDDPVFLPPGDMPARIAEAARRTGQPAPADRAATVRCVLESLALAHRSTLREAARLSGRRIGRVHLVGGGSRNELLCQWTADATGLPVSAGPAEATALGNILLQARADGAVGDMSGMRELVARTQDVRHYRPRAHDRRAWDAAAARLERGRS